jgi:hypothetical protein
MASIRRVDYFNTTVRDEPGQAFTVLSALADRGVNLLAFHAVPSSDTRTELTLFPESTGPLTTAARQAGLALDGPHAALLVQGDDHIGALAEIHESLRDAKVNVYASNGIVVGGNFGYIIHVRPGDFARALDALKVTS